MVRRRNVQVGGDGEVVADSGSRCEHRGASEPAHGDHVDREAGPRGGVGRRGPDPSESGREEQIIDLVGPPVQVAEQDPRRRPAHQQVQYDAKLIGALGPIA